MRSIIARPNAGDVREALQKLDPLWDKLFPAEKERIVKLLAQEVVVSPAGLLIRLRLNGLNSLVAELQPSASNVSAVESRRTEFPVGTGSDCA